MPHICGATVDGAAVDEESQSAEIIACGNRDDVHDVSLDCHAAVDDETRSEASTDVGDEDEDIEGRAEHGEDSETETTTDIPKGAGRLRADSSASSRPVLAKVERHQRIGQLMKVVDEFCTLDFDAVDASAQSGLVLRMLAVLKSLRVPVVFYSISGERHQQRRYALLDILEDDMLMFDDLVKGAEQLCEKRGFRQAFNLLKEARPRLRNERPDRVDAADDTEEAMAQRRLEKKQRQRKERTEQRRLERVNASSASSERQKSVQQPQGSMNNGNW